MLRICLVFEDLVGLLFLCCFDTKTPLLREALSSKCVTLLLGDELALSAEMSSNSDDVS